MAIYLGNTLIDKVYLGNTNISEVYLGEVLLYQDEFEIVLLTDETDIHSANTLGVANDDTTINSANTLSS